MTTRWRDAAALAFLLVLTAGVYWPLTISRDYTWLENPDQGLQVRPWLDFEAREIHAGRLPLWDPYLWGGQSLIGQVQPGVANPINWVLWAMPLHDGHIPIETLHWYWVLIHWLAAALLYWLCRDLGCGVMSSLAGACVFAFLGFVGHSLSPQFIMSALWIPAVLLFFARVFRGQRPWSSAALCAVAMGLAFLSGHHNIPIYTAVVMGVVWLWYILAGPGTSHTGGKNRGGPLGPAPLQRAMHAAVFLAVWLLVSGVQSLPALEYGRESVRWAGVPEPQRWHDKLPYSVHAEYSLYAKSIPGMVIPGLKVHADPFVGVVAFTLALAALLGNWRSRDVRLLAVVALAALLLALGKDTPVHWLAYRFIPMVDKARYPALAIAIFEAAIAALAALGLETCRKARPSKIVFGWLAMFAVGASIAYSLHRFPLEQNTLIIAGVAVALAAILYWGRAYPAAVLALVLIEVVAYPMRFDRRDRPNSIASMMEAQSDIAAFLKRQPGWFRVDADEDVVPYNFGDWFGIEQFGGYVASMPFRIHMINGHLETPAQLGIRYHIGLTPSRNARTLVFESRTGLKVFEDKTVAEPLRAVHDAACPTPDRLHIAERVPGVFVIDADLACDGLVVAGDPWFQGWRGWVDGRRQRIRDFEGVVRAVSAGAGRHRIEFRYRPGSVYWGAVLTALGFALAGLIRWLENRDRLPKPAQI